MIRTEERYTTATASDDLRMDTRGHAPIADVDVLTAAAWAPARLGSALLRLASEYSRPIRLQGLPATDALLLLGQLRTLPDVRRELAIKLSDWGCERPGDAALAIIAWWLHKVCSACNGRGYDVVPGTARLSARACKRCDASGEARLPLGDMGRRAANYMDDCLQAARAGLRRALRP